MIINYLTEEKEDNVALTDADKKTYCAFTISGLAKASV